MGLLFTLLLIVAISKQALIRPMPNQPVRESFSPTIVTASKAAGARTVWLDHGLDDDQSGFSTAGADEVAWRRQQAKEALQSGQVDERIVSLAQLPRALESLSRQTSRDAPSTKK